MSQGRVHRTLQLACAMLCTLTALALPALAAPSQYHGQVTFHGWSVPGATVTVTQGTQRVSTVSDQGGLFAFTDLEDGPARVE
ncbi:MAG: hypothetical protein WA741_33655, partial [Candidatus Sulfotelmatobacter sp.]